MSKHAKQVQNEVKKAAENALPPPPPPRKVEEVQAELEAIQKDAGMLGFLIEVNKQQLNQMHGKMHQLSMEIQRLTLQAQAAEAKAKADAASGAPVPVAGAKAGE